MSTSTRTSQELQYAQRITERLTQGLDGLPYDISERLRAARMQALTKRKLTLPADTKPVPLYGNTVARPNRWWQLVAALPLATLVIGLVAISTMQIDQQISELAEVDTALLSDELPPTAYTDPGFVEFLKTQRSAGL